MKTANEMKLYHWSLKLLQNLQNKQASTFCQKEKRKRIPAKYNLRIVQMIETESQC